MSSSLTRRFNLVGYGCMTCIGNSGPLPDAVVQAVDKVRAVDVTDGVEVGGDLADGVTSYV